MREEMQTPDYGNYSATDFSKDPQFIEHIFAGGEKAADFFSDLYARYPEKAPEIEQGARIVRTARIEKTSLSPEEISLDVELAMAKFRRRSALRRLTIMSSAAAIIAMIALPALLLRSGSEENELVKLESLIQNNPGKAIRLVVDGAAMDLEGDAELAFSSDGILSVKDETGEKRLAAAGTPQPVMNRLVVPGGRRSRMTLPDGSHIWVNSGTTLEFPSFFAGDSREIKVNGEVYIEVAHDPAKPFRLRTSSFNVNVTGTSFNVYAYEDEPQQSVALIEGKVSVDAHGEVIGMEPMDIIRFDGEEVDRGRIRSVDDILSWRDGILTFRSQPLGGVLASVSRYYGIPIVTDSARDIRITGKLFLFDDITTVLENITLIAPVTFSISDDAILITGKNR